MAFEESRPLLGGTVYEIESGKVLGTVSHVEEDICHVNTNYKGVSLFIWRFTDSVNSFYTWPGKTAETRRQELLDKRISAHTLANGVALNACWWENEPAQDGLRPVLCTQTPDVARLVARRMHGGTWRLYNGMHSTQAEYVDVEALDAFILQVKPA